MWNRHTEIGRQLGQQAGQHEFACALSEYRTADDPDRDRHQSIDPPLASIHWPVTHRESSAARNATMSAMSSGWATRFNGDWAATADRPSGEASLAAFMSVSVLPGPTAFTVIPRGATCLARVAVNESTAALDIA